MPTTNVFLCQQQFRDNSGASTLLLKSAYSVLSITGWIFCALGSTVKTER